MRSIRSILTFAILGASLTSCGILNTLLPDQTLTNPLGIHGEPVTLIQDGIGPLISAQQVWSTGSEPIEVAIQDIDDSEIPGWVDPSALIVDVGIENNVVLSSSTATSAEDFGDTFTLDMAAFRNGSITDHDDSKTADLPDFTTPDGASVSLAKVQENPCVGAAPMVCTYTAVDGLADFVIEVLIDGPDMDALYEILTTGSETNTISITMELAATGTAPSDTTITVILDAPTGTLTF